MLINYPFPLADLVITLRRGACYGFCPIYSVSLFGTGELVYTGDKFVKVSGVIEEKTNPLEVFYLFKFAVETGFFELRDEYVSGEEIQLTDDLMVDVGHSDITDRPSCTVSISTGKETKSVIDYLGAPKRLKQLERKIEQLANTKRWV